jgi:hypothetical protein
VFLKRVSLKTDSGYPKEKGKGKKKDEDTPLFPQKIQVKPLP